MVTTLCVFFKDGGLAGKFWQSQNSRRAEARVEFCLLRFFVLSIDIYYSIGYNTLYDENDVFGEGSFFKK